MCLEWEVSSLKSINGVLPFTWKVKDYWWWLVEVKVFLKKRFNEIVDGLSLLVKTEKYITDKIVIGK